MRKVSWEAEGGRRPASPRACAQNATSPARAMASNPTRYLGLVGCGLYRYRDCRASFFRRTASISIRRGATWGHAVVYGPRTCTFWGEKGGSVKVEKQHPHCSVQRSGREARE